MNSTKFTQYVSEEMEKIYKMYHIAIMYKAKEILKDESLAEDCMHEVMIKLANNLDKLGEYGSPKAKGYIFTITQNQAIDMYRRRKHEITIGLVPSEKRFGFDDVSNNDKPIGRYGYDESLDFYLDNLDEIDQAIVGLKYDYNMKHKEIAELLGKSLSSIDKRSERIKTKVKGFIMERAEDEDE